MQGAQPPAIRFRTELVSGLASWLVVFAVYAAGGLILFELYKFVEAYAGVSQLILALTELPTDRLKAGLSSLDSKHMEVRQWVAILAFTVVVAMFGGGSIFFLRVRDLERLLAARARELEEVDRSRRLFFAKASHELRTPITALRMEADVALTDKADAELTREALRQIKAQAKFLGHRIEEMIGIAQTADGKLHLDRKKLDLSEVVESAVDEARLFAKSVEASLNLVLPDKPVALVGDPLWLKRATLAVIENALKFSPIGGVVSISLDRRESYARVTVCDQGPGVVANELPLIFEAYYQTETGRGRGGNGLGLAMTRWVTEQHGGKTWANNLGSYRRPSGCAVTLEFGGVK